jgi:hypothetical protein
LVTMIGARGLSDAVVDVDVYGMDAMPLGTVANEWGDRRGECCMHPERRGSWAEDETLVPGTWAALTGEDRGSCRRGPGLQCYSLEVQKMKERNSHRPADQCCTLSSFALSHHRDSTPLTLSLCLTLCGRHPPTRRMGTLTFGWFSLLPWSIFHLTLALRLVSAINIDHQGLPAGFRTRLGAKGTEFFYAIFSRLLPFPLDSGPPPKLQLGQSIPWFQVDATCGGGLITDLGCSDPFYHMSSIQQTPPFFSLRLGCWDNL